MHIQYFPYTIIWLWLLNTGEKCLIQIFQTELRTYSNTFVPKYNITLLEWNHDMDHVHILFKAHPNSEISKFINAYKSASSRLIKKEFPCIREKLWKEAFWSQSFFLITTGESSVDIIRDYIETQGEKVRWTLCWKHTSTEYIQMQSRCSSLQNALDVCALSTTGCFQTG